jgi:hypothetical protein
MFASVLRCLTGERDRRCTSIVCCKICRMIQHVRPAVFLSAASSPGLGKTRFPVLFVMERKFVPNRWLSVNTVGFSYSAPFSSVTIFGLHTNKLQNQTLFYLLSTRLFVSAKTCF